MIKEVETKSSVSFKPLIVPIKYKYKNILLAKNIMNHNNNKILRKLGIYISIYEGSILITRLPKYLDIKKYNMLIDDIFESIKKWYSDYFIYDENFFMRRSINIILKYCTKHHFSVIQSENLFFYMVKNNLLSNKNPWCKTINMEFLKKFVSE